MYSYSQFGEDVFISQQFDENYKGICIDIGATDGIWYNNTFHFEKNGWKSICIEANPNMIPKLQQNRINVVNCAVGQFDNDNVDFTVVTLDGENQTAISSLKVDERLLESHMYLNPEISTIKIPEKTLKRNY